MSNSPVPAKSWPDVLAPFSELIQKLCGPAFEQYGLSWGEAARFSRMRRLAKILEKTKGRLEEAGIEPKAVRPNLLHDIIDRASLEDDDSLQDKWANLLARSADGKTAIHNSFPDILKSLSPEEAIFLTKLFDRTGDNKAAWYLSPVHYANLRRQSLIMRQDELSIPIVAAGNAVPSMQITMGSAPEKCFLSEFGTAFVIACTAPRKEG